MSDRRWPWLLGLLLALAGTLWMTAQMLAAIWAVLVSLLTGALTPMEPNWSAASPVAAMSASAVVR